MEWTHSMITALWPLHMLGGCWRGIVVERQSLTGELSQSGADG